ncbi:MAG: MFS transporter [Rikenellaceae bacterium]|nr:MFS transporter [Rikenellaceae bacterium]MDE7356518.1 MFS transporter [Rikenellaceae bacterium]
MAHDRKLLTFFSLYVAQSVPMSFFTTVIPVVMRQNDFSLRSIGLLQLVRLPWLVKFLWAPYVDGSAGKRGYKRWIIASELFYAVMIMCVGLLNLDTDLGLIVTLVILAVTASATQDIATDAFAVVLFRGKNKGMVNSMQSMGSFVGTLCGSGLMLIVYKYVGWSLLLPLLVVFVVVALLPLAGLRTTAVTASASGSADIMPTPDAPTVTPSVAETTQAVCRPGQREMFAFFTRPGILRQGTFLLLYYAGIMGSLSMIKPWMVDMGYDVGQIGFISGVIGTAMAAASSFVAGLTVKRLGLERCRLMFAAIVAAVAVVVWLLSLLGCAGIVAVTASVVAVWCAYGMATIVVLTAAMEYVRPGLEGTDFTLQTVITQLSGMIMAVMGGYVADRLGYTGLFAVGAAMGLVNLWYVARFFRKPRMAV